MQVKSGERRVAKEPEQRVNSVDNSRVMSDAGDMTPTEQTLPDRWQAAAARHRFGDVVDAAVAGRPQFIRRRDGQEVVVVSRDHFEKTKANMQNFLLTSGYADDADDLFDRAVRDARGLAGGTLEPRHDGMEHFDDEHSGHRQR
jgi:prevent-host-death family protein